MTFAGGITKESQIPFAAGMAAFAAALAGARQAFQTLAAGLTVFSATLTKKTSRALTAALPAFAGTIVRTLGRSFAAAPAAFSATITKHTARSIAAGHTAWSVVFDATKGAAVEFTAGMAAFSGSITRKISKFFTAS